MGLVRTMAMRKGAALASIGRSRCRSDFNPWALVAPAVRRRRVPASSARTRVAKARSAGASRVRAPESSAVITPPRAPPRPFSVRSALTVPSRSGSNAARLTSDSLALALTDWTS